MGTSTTGSSEAVQLGGLAMKRRWQEVRRAKGLPTSNPNIVMGAHAQVALLKFARYFDVEPRIAPVTVEGGYGLTAGAVSRYIDENTSTIPLLFTPQSSYKIFGQWSRLPTFIAGMLIISKSWGLCYSGEYLHRPLRQHRANLRQTRRVSSPDWKRHPNPCRCCKRRSGCSLYVL